MTLRNYINICNDIANINRNVNVFVSSETPTSNYKGYATNAGKSNLKRRDFAAYLRNALTILSRDEAFPKLEYIYLFEELNATNTFRGTQLMSDNLHYNASGANRVLKYLLENSRVVRRDGWKY